MKKLGLLILLLQLFSISFFNTTEAKLTIIPPEEMVKQSTLIVIGTVTKKEYTEQQREVHFSVETVIKGKTTQNEIELRWDKPPMYGWLGFDFPETGTRIIVLLQQNDQQLTLTGDANAVAILDGNYVKLYKGSTMGHWTPEQYEETYKVFLDKSIQSTQMPIDILSNKGETTNFSVKSQHLKFNIALIIGVMVVTSFLLYRILKRKRLN